MKRMLKNDWAAILLLGLLQGFLNSVSLEPYNIALAGWFLPWPLFYFAGRFRKSLPKMIIAGISCSFFFNIFTFYWMVELFSIFGGMSRAESVAAFIPYAAFSTLQFPAFIILFGLSLRIRFRRYLRPRWLTAGFIALVVDYFVPRVFPCCWGNFIAGNSLVVQVADILGVFGLTFILFSVSYFFYRIAGMTAVKMNGRVNVRGTVFLIGRNIVRPYLLRRLYPAPLMLILCLSYGLIQKHRYEKIQEGLPTVRVAIINPNAPPEDQNVTGPRELKRLMYETIPALVERAVRAGEGMTDLVVLPESAVPFLCAEETVFNRLEGCYSPQFEKMAQLIAYNWNADVFFNETSYKKIRGTSAAGRVRVYNSSALYSRDGVRRDTYQKRILLAFGEYMPGEKFLESSGITKLVPALAMGSRFAAGERSNLIPYSMCNRKRPYYNVEPRGLSSIDDLSPVQFAQGFPPGRTFFAEGRFMPLICYEVLFPNHVRSFFSGDRPDFIVNITQDGWYGNTNETYQHYELGRIRSVETRRALVRAVNNGAAGFVDLAGNYVRPLAGPVMTRPQAESFQVWDVPVNRGGPTLYVRFGDIWMALLAMIFLALPGWRFFRCRGSRR